MQDYIPYVYIIKNKTTGLKYIGVRYAKGCNPSDLFKTYFTSSKLIHKLISSFGVGDFIYKILHRYPNNPNMAIKKEANYFKFIKKRNDYLNITYSSGCIDLRISSKAGKVGGAIVYNDKIGIFRDYGERKEWAKLGGFVGGTKQKKLGIGIFGLSVAEKLKNCSKGGKIGVMRNGWKDSAIQSQNGSRGGKANKGFIWYNDGVANFKYTKKQQEILQFEDFVAENSTIRKGRLPT